MFDTVVRAKVSWLLCFKGNEEVKDGLDHDKISHGPEENVLRCQSFKSK